jgi:phosphatidylglycerol:prolipoprotein diacylglycerol transferase
MAWWLWRWQQRPHAQGQVFRGFMATYLGWRLLEDFLKPQPMVAGMNWIQWACVVGLVWLGVSELLRRRRLRNDTSIEDAGTVAKVSSSVE